MHPSMCDFYGFYGFLQFLHYSGYLVDLNLLSLNQVSIGFAYSMFLIKMEINFLCFFFSSSLWSLSLNFLSLLCKIVNHSASQIFLSLSLCIVISSNSITFSLKCVMQGLIFSVIVFWSNWHKLSLISIVAPPRCNSPCRGEGAYPLRSSNQCINKWSLSERCGYVR